MEKIINRNLKNGDIILSKSNPLVWHYAVFYSDSSDNKYLTHNDPHKNIIIEKWNVFFHNRKLIGVLNSKISGIDSDLLITKVNELKEKKFNLFFYNCEDYIFDLTGTKPKVNQLQHYILILLFFFFIPILFLNRKKIA